VIPRKLTPAEALEVFRDWRAVERADMTSTAFYDKWGTFDRAVSDAIDAIEEAMAQKPPAEVDVAKAWAGHVQWMAELEARDKALLERIKSIRPTEPADPVPIINIEPGKLVVVSPGAACRFTDRVIVRRFDEHEPAAPWPNDRSILQAIDEKIIGRDLKFVLRMLARRIGVQGVPQ